MKTNDPSEWVSRLSAEEWCRLDWQAKLNLDPEQYESFESIKKLVTMAKEESAA